MTKQLQGVMMDDKHQSMLNILDDIVTAARAIAILNNPNYTLAQAQRKIDYMIENDSFRCKDYENVEDDCDDGDDGRGEPSDEQHT